MDPLHDEHSISTKNDNQRVPRPKSSKPAKPPLKDRNNPATQRAGSPPQEEGVHSVRQAFQTALNKISQNETREIALKEIQGVISANTAPMHLRIYFSSLRDPKRECDSTTKELEVLILSYIASVFKKNLLDPLDKPPELLKSVVRLCEYIHSYFKDVNQGVQMACAKALKEVYSSCIEDESNEIVSLIMIEPLYSILNGGADRATQQTAAYCFGEMVKVFQLKNKNELLENAASRLYTVFLKTNHDFPDLLEALAIVIFKVGIRNLQGRYAAFAEKLCNIVDSKIVINQYYLTKIEACGVLLAYAYALKGADAEQKVLDNLCDRVIPVLQNASKNKIFKVQQAGSEALKFWISLKGGPEAENVKLELPKIASQGEAERAKAENERRNEPDGVAHNFKQIRERLKQAKFDDNTKQNEMQTRGVSVGAEQDLQNAKFGSQNRGQKFMKARSGTGGGYVGWGSPESNDRKKFAHEKQKKSIKDLIQEKMRPQSVGPKPGDRFALIAEKEAERKRQSREDRSQTPPLRRNFSRNEEEREEEVVEQEEQQENGEQNEDEEENNQEVVRGRQGRKRESKSSQNQESSQASEVYDTNDAVESKAVTEKFQKQIPSSQIKTDAGVGGNKAAPATTNKAQPVKKPAPVQEEVRVPAKKAPEPRNNDMAALEGKLASVIGIPREQVAAEIDERAEANRKRKSNPKVQQVTKGQGQQLKKREKGQARYKMAPEDAAMVKGIDFMDNSDFQTESNYIDEYDAEAGAQQMQTFGQPQGGSSQSNGQFTEKMQRTTNQLRTDAGNTKGKPAPAQKPVVVQAPTQRQVPAEEVKSNVRKPAPRKNEPQVFNMDENVVTGYKQPAQEFVEKVEVNRLAKNVPKVPPKAARKKGDSAYKLTNEDAALFKSIEWMDNLDLQPDFNGIEEYMLDPNQYVNQPQTNEQVQEEVEYPTKNRAQNKNPAVRRNERTNAGINEHLDEPGTPTGQAVVIEGDIIERDEAEEEDEKEEEEREQEEGSQREEEKDEEGGPMAPPEGMFEQEEMGEGDEGFMNFFGGKKDKKEAEKKPEPKKEEPKKESKGFFEKIGDTLGFGGKDEKKEKKEAAAKVEENKPQPQAKEEKGKEVKEQTVEKKEEKGVSVTKEEPPKEKKEDKLLPGAPVEDWVKDKIDVQEPKKEAEIKAEPEEPHKKGIFEKASDFFHDKFGSPKKEDKAAKDAKQETAKAQERENSRSKSPENPKAKKEEKSPGFFDRINPFSSKKKQTKKGEDQDETQAEEAERLDGVEDYGSPAKGGKGKEAAKKQNVNEPPGKALEQKILAGLGVNASAYTGQVGGKEKESNVEAARVEVGRTPGEKEERKTGLVDQGLRKSDENLEQQIMEEIGKNMSFYLRHLESQKQQQNQTPEKFQKVSIVKNEEGLPAIRETVKEETSGEFAGETLKDSLMWTKKGQDVFNKHLVSEIQKGMNPLNQETLKWGQKGREVFDERLAQEIQQGIDNDSLAWSKKGQEIFNQRNAEEIRRGIEPPRQDLGWNQKGKEVFDQRLAEEVRRGMEPPSQDLGWNQKGREVFDQRLAEEMRRSSEPQPAANSSLGWNQKGREMFDQRTVEEIRRGMEPPSKEEIRKGMEPPSQDLGWNQKGREMFDQRLAEEMRRSSEPQPPANSSLGWNQKGREMFDQRTVEEIRRGMEPPSKDLGWNQKGKEVFDQRLAEEVRRGMEPPSQDLGWNQKGREVFDQRLAEEMRRGSEPQPAANGSLGWNQKGREMFDQRTVEEMRRGMEPPSKDLDWNKKGREVFDQRLAEEVRRGMESPSQDLGWNQKGKEVFDEYVAQEMRERLANDSLGWNQKGREMFDQRVAEEIRRGMEPPRKDLNWNQKGHEVFDNRLVQQIQGGFADSSSIDDVIEGRSVNKQAPMIRAPQRGAEEMKENHPQYVSNIKNLLAMTNANKSLKSNPSYPQSDRDHNVKFSSLGYTGPQNYNIEDTELDVPEDILEEIHEGYHNKANQMQNRTLHHHQNDNFVESTMDENTYERFLQNEQRSKLPNSAKLTRQVTFEPQPGRNVPDTPNFVNLQDSVEDTMVFASTESLPIQAAGPMRGTKQENRGKNHMGETVMSMEGDYVNAAWKPGKTLPSQKMQASHSGNFSSGDAWNKAIEDVSQGNYEAAYNRILTSGDDIYLLRLLKLTGPCLKKLNRATAMKLLKRTIALQKSSFFEKMALGFFENAHRTQITHNMKIEEQNQLLKVLYGLSAKPSMVGQTAAGLHEAISNDLRTI